MTTKKNINRFREQLQSLGFSYDWSREVATTEPRYYKWTQWIFLQLLQNDLAFTAEVPVNWCPALGTVLANEEVIDGLSERGSHPVFRMPMKQWMLKITQYADRLLTDLDPLAYDLLFERFYNAGRNTEDHVSLPDIDIDVPGGKRDEIILYLK